MRNREGFFQISVLTWNATISRPKDLAEALARHARETLRRLERQSAEALAPLREALSKVLGLHFTDWSVCVSACISILSGLSTCVSLRKLLLLFP
jgi:hypothetical protein